MSQKSEKRQFRSSRGAGYPLLLECDRQGNVLWMSERTRVALGALETLLGTIPTTDNPSGGVCLSRIWEGGGRVLIGGHPERPPEKETLADLEVNLNRNYLRLLEAERSLSSMARERRGGRVNAIRQLELERQRLGRELHTNVGQLLSAIRLQLEVIAQQIRTPAPAVQQALDRIMALASQALDLVRSISQRLHPPDWQRLPIEAAIQQLWELSGIPQHFDSHLEMEGLPQEPDLDAKILVYRAAQEAVANIIRHSHATRVEASLQARNGSLVLRVQDNGVGFDPSRFWSAPPNLSGGIGLRTIREQAEALGGHLELESGANGTTLEITVPLQMDRE